MLTKEQLSPHALNLFRRVKAELPPSIAPPAMKLWRNESLRFYHHRCPDVGGFIKLTRFPIGHPDASV